MSALLKKEFRLLLPAWIAATLLTIAPFPLCKVFRYGWDVAFGFAFYTVPLGCLILGAVGFGREFESRTFALLLVQPRQRRELWRAKITALLVALVPLGLLVFLFDRLWVSPEKPWWGVFLWLAITSALTTGGLWTSLLLRQFFTVFWISLLLPIALIVPAMTLFDEQISLPVRVAITCFLLIAYSVAGYLLARRLFRTAQDAQWTGGDLTLSSVAKWMRWTRTVARPGKMHPLRALFKKEFHLHESSLLAAGLLLIAQLAALVLSRFAENPQASVLGVLPMVMWCLWLVMPALVGCAGVAEERKLGTLESQLCLPASRAWQFVVKVCVTLALGTALGAIVPITTAPLNPAERFHWEFVWGWTLVCLGITTVCFYASSLARYALHAFAVAIAFVVVWAFLLNWLNGEFVQRGGSFTLFGHFLWRGVLVFVVGAFVMLLFAMGQTWRRLRWIWLGFIALVSLLLYRGTIQSFLDRVFYESTHTYWERIIFQTMALSLTLGPTLLMLALAAKNFKHTQTRKSLWLRNVAAWITCLLVTMIVTPLVYNRFWEFGKPFEPPAGPPRLSGLVRPVITGPSDERPTFVLLPDGRLCWLKGLERIVPIISQATPSEPRFRAIKNPRINSVADSNWVAIAKAESELLGIKSDGSLWSASLLEWISPDGEHPPKFKRIGNASDWKAVAAGQFHVVALKRDGTIWGWGSIFRDESGGSPNPFTDGPVRIGEDSDWTNVFTGLHESFGVKRDGSIWKWGRPTYDRDQKIAGIYPAKLNLSVTGVRAIFSERGSVDYDLILDETGNLWGVGNIPWYLIGLDANRTRFKPEMPCRLPIPSSSAIAAAERRGIAGIRADGRLWDQDADDLRTTEPTPVYRVFGQRTDWIATTIERDSILALAKDGTLCRFGEPFRPHWELELLAPLRRVTWSVNVLDAQP